MQRHVGWKDKTDESDSVEDTTKLFSRKGISDRVPVYLVPLINLDKIWTNRLAICSGSQSFLAILRPYMKFLELSCHGIPWLVGCLVLLFYCRSTSSQEMLVNVFVALILDILSVGVLKAVFRRRRPVHNQDDMLATVSLDIYSFPSGHASRAVMLCLLFMHKCGLGLSLFLGTLLVTWSAAVSISRIFLGRHHIGDVLAGGLLGYFEYIVIDWLWFEADAINSILWFFDVDVSEP